MEPTPEVVGTEPEEEDELILALRAIMAAVQAQLRPCWQADPNSAATVAPVLIDVTLNRNGPVRRTQIRDLGRLHTDQSMSQMAEDARAAIMKCSPFDLPRREYRMWRTITLRFYPR